MKTIKESISNASFIGSILKLLFKKIRKQQTLKKVVLLLVVLLCVLTRFIALSGDKLKIRDKPESVMDKYLKFRIRVPSIYSENSNPSTPKIKLLKFRNVEFKQRKSSTEVSISN